MGALEVESGGVGTLKSPDMQELHFQELKKKSFTPPENNVGTIFKRVTLTSSI